jgi:hypothetical protein
MIDDDDDGSEEEGINGFVDGTLMFCDGCHGG